MVARACYAVLAAALVGLAVIALVRFHRGRELPVPLVAPPSEVAGQSCDAALNTARALTQSGRLDRARMAYLWIVGHCEQTTVLPEATLELASLLAYRLGQTREAAQVYRSFLERFPSDPEAPNALYHLAKLEIDAGRYASAVAHLTALANQYPGSSHEQSARFLAGRAAQMLVAEKDARRTVTGQIAELVPNNFLSFLVLLTALAPSIIQAVSKAREDRGGSRRWVMPGVIIGLTIVNYTINNVDSARRNRDLMERIDRILAVGSHAEGRQ